MSKPGNRRLRPGEATDHGIDHGIGAPGERAGYVTHEEQLLALLAYKRRRDRRLARAIVTALSAPPTTLAAFGEIAGFVARQARREGRDAGGGGDRSRLDRPAHDDRRDPDRDARGRRGPCCAVELRRANEADQRPCYGECMSAGSQHTIDLDPMRPILDRVIARWKPLQIWLFGSRARGEAGPDSDWDLLAIVPDCPEPADFDDPMTVWRVKRQPGVSSDLVVYRASDFEEDRTVPNTLAYSTTMDGLLVYEARPRGATPL